MLPDILPLDQKPTSLLLVPSPLTDKHTLPILESHRLTRRQASSIHHLLHLLRLFALPSMKWTSRQSHQTYNTMISLSYLPSIVPQEEEYSPVLALSRIPNGLINFIKLSIRLGFAETSTIQLLVEISNTLPPN